MKRLVGAIAILMASGGTALACAAYGHVPGGNRLTEAQCRVLESAAMVARIEDECAELMYVFPAVKAIFAREMLRITDLLDEGPLARVQKEVLASTGSVLDASRDSAMGNDRRLCTVGWYLFGPNGSREPGLLKSK